MEPSPSTGLQKGHSQSSSGCEGHKHQLPPVLLWFGGASGHLPARVTHRRQPMLCKVSEEKTWSINS